MSGASKRLPERFWTWWIVGGVLLILGALATIFLFRMSPFALGGRDTGGQQPTVARGSDVADATSDAESWAPLSVMRVVDPRDYGAVGDGKADDHGALSSAIGDLADTGGLVLIGDGQWFRISDVLEVTVDHVKFWSPTAAGGIVQQVGSEAGRQAVWCHNTDGCGFFGLQLVSDAQGRLDSLLDHQITLDGAKNSEIVGVEISGSAATGVFSFGGSQDTRIQGSYVHHTWADGIHFTDGSRGAYVWDNTYFNDEPSLGDDGIACVTYGRSPLCGDMEWWNNVHLGGGGGRGFAVIGGEDISIHDNFVRESAAAGILVASEPGYDTSSSRNITIARNVVLDVSHSVGHPGILISGLNDRVEPIRSVDLQDNVVVGTRTGQPFASEGAVEEITNTGLTTDAARLPTDLPQIGQELTLANTSVLRTWDTSFVPEETRRGLYRIHVRRSGTGELQQRFEYVVQAESDVVSDWLATFGASGETPPVLSHRGVWSEGTPDVVRDVAVILSPQPLAVPEALTPVTFAELRQADLDGSGTALWRILN